MPIEKDNSPYRWMRRCSSFDGAKHLYSAVRQGGTLHIENRNCFPKMKTHSVSRYAECHTSKLMTQTTNFGKYASFFLISWSRITSLSYSLTPNRPMRRALCLVLKIPVSDSERQIILMFTWSLRCHSIRMKRCSPVAVCTVLDSLALPNSCHLYRE